MKTSKFYDLARSAGEFLSTIAARMNATERVLIRLVGDTLTVDSWCMKGDLLLVTFETSVDLEAAGLLQSLTQMFPGSVISGSLITIDRTDFL